MPWFICLYSSEVKEILIINWRFSCLVCKCFLFNSIKHSVQLVSSFLFTNHQSIRSFSELVRVTTPTQQYLRFIYDSTCSLRTYRCTGSQSNGILARDVHVSSLDSGAERKRAPQAGQRFNLELLRVFRSQSFSSIEINDVGNFFSPSKFDRTHIFSAAHIASSDSIYCLVQICDTIDVCWSEATIDIDTNVLVFKKSTS